MTRSDLLSLCRLYVPEVDSNVISDANVYILLNQAAQEFVTVAEALPTSTLFNSSDDTGEYNISTSVPTYAKSRKEGLWWYDDDNSKWTKLDTVTIEILNQKFPYWRDDDAGSPKRYAIDGDVITVHPKVETGGENKFRLYHYAISTDMSAAGHYPFTGSTTRYPFLAKYEENLVQYYISRAKKVMGYGDEAVADMQVFVAMAEQAKAELRKRPDIARDAHIRPRTQMQHYRTIGGPRTRI